MKKWLLMMAVLLVSLLAACGDQEDTKKDSSDEATSVETAKVTKGDLVTKKRFYGQTTPKSTTPIMTQTPGEVDSLHVSNGDKVKKDDKIATIKGAGDLKAPKDGVIAQLQTDEGEMTSDSDPFAVVADLDTLKIKLQVTSDVLDLFEKDTSYKTTVGKHKGKLKVTSIDKLPGDTGLYPIEGTIKNDKHKMHAGEMATVFVPEKKVKNAIRVPTSALVMESDQSYVFKIVDDKAKKVKVTVKETQSDQSAIKGDIKKDDTVITKGQDSLKDGSKVDVVRAGNES